MRSESRVQEEIGQKRRFRTVAQEATVALLRTADYVRRHLERVAAGEGLTLPQYNVLRIIRGAGPDGIPTLQISDRLIERAPAITRMLDRLEAKGWVERFRSPEDRRQVMCFLTTEGKRLVDVLDEPMDLADESAVEALDPREQRELVDRLDRIRSELG